MVVTIGRNIKIVEPTPEVIKWCDKNLIVPNPDYQKKLRMHFWLGNTPKTLVLYETQGTTLFLPFGVIRPILPLIRGAEILTAFPVAEDIDFRCDVPLYDYQQEAVNALVKAQYGILQSAAGSGKTQMGVALAAKLGKRTLWLTHTADLLSQSKERAERYMPPELIGTITEGKVNVGEAITFATVQTMCRLDLTQYRDMWDVIICDESHRIAGTPTATTQFYKVLNALAARHKYGLSATVHRADGLIRATYALVGGVVYSVPDEAVADKIMRVGVKPLLTGTRIDESCLNTDGTLNFTSLVSYLAGNDIRNHYIAAWLTSDWGKPTLVLSDRLEHLESIMRCLPAAMRAEAVMISGKMTTKKGKEERRQALDDMRSGKKKYLFATYSLAKEGLDIPCLERLYMTTPVKDYAVVTQSVGRIARTCEGKGEPLVYDFVDDIGYCIKAYKKRCTSYRKLNCYFVSESEEK